MTVIYLGLRITKDAWKNFRYAKIYKFDDGLNIWDDLQVQYSDFYTAEIMHLNWL
jgi:hypothetical protein